MSEPLPPLTDAELLDAVSYALNVVKNTRLLACPHGFKNTYAIAAYLDAKRHREQKERTDANR